MLTLILLVVLGGGAGLLAVSLIDSGGLSRLGRPGGRSLRGTARGNTPGSRAATVVAPEAVSDPDPAEPAATPPPGPRPPAPRPASTEPAFTDVVIVEQSPEAPVHRPPTRKVPAAFTAVEGSYREVARAPLWRKLVSLASLMVIVVVIGVAIAALAGAAIGAAAELVDGAIG